MKNTEIYYDVISLIIDRWVPQITETHRDSCAMALFCRISV